MKNSKNWYRGLGESIYTYYVYIRYIYNKRVKSFTVGLVNLNVLKNSIFDHLLKWYIRERKIRTGPKMKVSVIGFKLYKGVSSQRAFFHEFVKESFKTLKILSTPEMKISRGWWICYRGLGPSIYIICVYILYIRYIYNKRVKSFTVGLVNRNFLKNFIFNL